MVPKMVVFIDMLSRFDPSRADLVQSWSACQSRRWSGSVGLMPRFPKALATACSAARAAAWSIRRSMSASESLREEEGCGWVMRATIAAGKKTPAGAVIGKKRLGKRKEEWAGSPQASVQEWQLRDGGNVGFWSSLVESVRLITECFSL